MLAPVKKLNADCATKIRNSQVISKVSDVVRELVDNAIDAGAHSIQVFLENYGLRKIEVKDNGSGIPAEDVQLLFQGGYTSKLEDFSHLSCSKESYGFRGEALAAICSLSGVTIVTKTEKDAKARKFVLSKQGKVTSENVVPLGNGTVITVWELFKDYPVRFKHSSEPKVQRTQLKDIEFYLKCTGIANPGTYISLYHDGNLIWSKPAVKNTEQALTTILGVALAKNLSCCLTEELLPDQKENNEVSWKGELKLFVPKKPVDMRSMGYTSSKMTMVFVNRRLINADDYQNLIKRYAIGGAENPTQQEQRKFPLAVLIINVPSTEVDFNREVDKSKIFLTCHDSVMSKLESILQSYYGISLGILGGGDLTSELSVSCMSNDFNESCDPGNSEIQRSESLRDISAEESILNEHLNCVSTPEKRKENIESFVQNLPSSGKFSFAKSQPIPPRGTTLSTPKTAKEPFDIRDFTVASSDERESDKALRDVDDVVDKLIGASSGRSAIPSDGSGRVSNLSASTSPREKRMLSFTSYEGEPFKDFESFYELETATCQTTSAGSKDLESSMLSSSIDNIEVSYMSGPQCGAILHTEGPTQINSRMNIPNLPEPKRRKLLHHTSFEKVSSEYENPGKCQRQVTLDSLRNWSQKPSAVLGNVSFMQRSRNPITSRSPSPQPSNPTPRIEISESMLPHPVDYISNKGDSATRSKSNLWTDPCHSSVLGLNATVSVLSYSSHRKSGNNSRSNSGEIKVISKLTGTLYYIVKIDGLLGVFNPSRFLALYPHLSARYASDVCHDDHSSSKRVEEMLEEFSGIVDNIDVQAAAEMFEVLADLQEGRTSQNSANPPAYVEDT